MKPKGGARPGSGRKPLVAEIALIRKLSPMDEAAFKALKKGVESGDIDFIKLFFSYRFGKPKEHVDLTTNGESISKITLILT